MSLVTFSDFFNTFIYHLFGILLMYQVFFILPSLIDLIFSLSVVVQYFLFILYSIFHARMNKEQIPKREHCCGIFW